jgi:hypothetical protein
MFAQILDLGKQYLLGQVSTTDKEGRAKIIFTIIFAKNTNICQIKWLIEACHREH